MKQKQHASKDSSLHMWICYAVAASIILWSVSYSWEQRVLQTASTYEKIIEIHSDEMWMMTEKIVSMKEEIDSLSSE